MPEDLLSKPMNNQKQMVIVCTYTESKQLVVNMILLLAEVKIIKKIYADKVLEVSKPVIRKLKKESTSNIMGNIWVLVLLFQNTPAVLGFSCVLLIFTVSPLGLPYY